MSKKRDMTLKSAEYMLRQALDVIKTAQDVCKAEELDDDVSELSHALDHTEQAITWLKITRGTWRDKA